MTSMQAVRKWIPVKEVNTVTLEKPLNNPQHIPANNFPYLCDVKSIK